MLMHTILGRALDHDEWRWVAYCGQADIEHCTGGWVLARVTFTTLSPITSLADTNDSINDSWSTPEPGMIAFVRMWAAMARLSSGHHRRVVDVEHACRMVSRSQEWKFPLDSLGPFARAKPLGGTY